MKRFLVGVLATLMLLAACTAQRSDIPPPSDEPMPTPSVSQRLTSWTTILHTFARGWNARPDSQQLRLSVIDDSSVTADDLRSCAEPPTFEATAGFLAYCRVTPAVDASEARPAGKVFIPYRQFVQALNGLRAKNSEQLTYDVLVVLLALFYADHLVGEGERVGLLPKGQTKEHHRYCLAGGIVRTSAQDNGVSLQSILQTLAVALPFIKQHRQNVPDSALSWLMRGLNSGSRLELSIMCA